jgi:hypothetical protein
MHSIHVFPMKRKRCTEQWIIKILIEAEIGVAVAKIRW